MRLEGDHQRFHASLSRPSHDLGQHPKMRAMHAIKIPYADHRRPEARRYLVKFAKNLHAIFQPERSNKLWFWVEQRVQRCLNAVPFSRGAAEVHESGF
jgi:hypothetical protein